MIQEMEALSQLPQVESLADPDSLFDYLCRSLGGTSLPVFIFDEEVLEHRKSSLFMVFGNRVTFHGCESHEDGDFNCANKEGELGFMHTARSRDVALGVCVELDLDGFKDLCHVYAGYRLQPVLGIDWSTYTQGTKEEDLSFSIAYVFQRKLVDAYKIHQDLLPRGKIYSALKSWSVEQGEFYSQNWMENTFLSDGKSPVWAWDAYGVLPVSTIEGQQRLKDATITGDFWQLIMYLETQENGHFCGVASAVVALNSLPFPGERLDHLAGFHLHSQSTFYEQHVVPVKRAGGHGIGLLELADAIRHHGLEVLAIPGDSCSLAELREQVKNALKDPSKRVIVHYHRQYVGQKTIGHFAPIAAYHEESDAFLILDVARYKYPSAWVPASHLHEAAASWDKASDMSRGFIILEAV